MRKMFKNAAFYILLFLLIVALFSQLISPNQNQEIKNYNLTELIKVIKNNEVATIKISDYSKVEGTLQDGTPYRSYIPEILAVPMGDYLFGLVEAKEGIAVSGVEPNKDPFFLDILPIIFSVLMIGLLWFMLMQNSQGGGSKVMSFGKSKARLIKDDDGKKINFDQVAGLKEEKEELWEVVDFLKHPKKYVEMGARIPKGMLMVGPPGTGKTYLSRAIAGEAGVPFFSISGSDFVEMFVGVGASRVRDLFENAKKNSPCIVFIDEIDAVGRKRGAGLGGGHDEREQTLNQLLVEMDGFTENEGIIVIAATNRPDILDPALLRPGRFDREITIGRPDVKEREEIIKVHALNKPVASDVDFESLAKGTPGFTPADIENLLNEAAIVSARKDQKKITMETLEEALNKILMGLEKKSKVITPKERRLTAYHEAGHAVLASLLPEADPVQQVTIIPRGRGAGGFTMYRPNEDSAYETKTSLETRLVTLLGGRVAEKLILGDISTGASSDLNRVAEISRAMIVKFAMSDNLGSMSYAQEEEVFLGKDMTTKKNYSEQVAAEIDREVRHLVDSAYDRAETLLSENLDKLHEVAKALLEFETINADEYLVAYEQGFEALLKYMDEKKDSGITHGYFSTYVKAVTPAEAAKAKKADAEAEAVKEAERAEASAVIKDALRVEEAIEKAAKDAEKAAKEAEADAATHSNEDQTPKV